MSEMQKKPLPELLCPAGSPEALDAAIEAGADAVYFGASLFNARMNAHNFGGDAMRSAVLRAHAYGVKVYLTLNTLVLDREIPDFLETAREAARVGVDALIVADLGGASILRRALPTMELHASTQASAHNAASAAVLRALGFSRMVIARETPERDLRSTTKSSPIEIEAFIHGALCVSHSGQCLFSSLVGGRSGNRGECAQPCRLPFACPRSSGASYPLSLKDLSLAAHVPALIESGVASLKIEGRMKSPEYVRDTTRIWRRLLDERRAATPAEMRELAEIFSRGGFTDGYWTERIDGKMLGIRSEDEKERSRALTPFTGITRKIPLSLCATMLRDCPMTLTVSDGTDTVTVEGDVPMEAINAPITKEALEKSLSKLGATVYCVKDFDATLDAGLMLPVSRLNDLRRRAIEAWEARRAPTVHEEHPLVPLQPSGKREPVLSARFVTPEQVTRDARAFFDRIYLPLGKETDGVDGVVLPPVIFDHEVEGVKQKLAIAAARGIRYALVGNLGHLSLATDAGLIPVGDFRLNITNRETVCVLERLGFDSMILSPELTLPQARDIGGNTAVTVYGRIPLMTVEKCVIKEIADCNACAEGKAELRDRRGVTFPVLREGEHRNVIYNSLPTCMSDRLDALSRAGLTARHFIFSTETPTDVDEVIRAFRKGAPLRGQVRRL